MLGATVFVMPSRIEPFGMVALEGWRAGVPIVVTSHGGPSEFVEDGVSGLVVDPYDREGLASALSSLLASGELRGRLAENGRLQLPNFAWATLTERYESIYASVSVSA